MARWLLLRARWLPVAGVAVFLVIYGADAGRGFVGDDFAWVAAGDTGSYRPLTALSFAVDHALFGMHARAYGLTNLLLALICAGTLTAVARALRLAWPAALGAAALWLFNFHGINMAVLSISGRSSLLLTTLALLVVLTYLSSRYLLSLLLAGAAMLAHEQAVTLPAMMTTWLLVAPDARDPDWRKSVKYAAGLWLVLGTYLWLRMGSGAFWFAPAPTAASSASLFSTVGRNLLEYADRSMTFGAVAVLLSAAYAHALPRLATLPARVLSFGLLWLAWGFGATLFLPQRSSLFVVLPSAGAMIVAAALVHASLSQLDERKLAPLRVVVVVVLLALVPVYWSRNARWTDLGRLSSTVIAQLRTHTATVGGNETIRIVDDVPERVRLSDAWGARVRDVARLTLGERVELVLTDDARPACPHPCSTAQLLDGQLVGWQASSPPPPPPAPPVDPSLVRRELWAELQPVTLTNCQLRRFGEAHDGGYLLCANLLNDVKAGYSYGISGYDGWGCDVARIRRIPVHEYDCFDTRVPACAAQTVFHPECVGPRRETIDSRPFDSIQNQIAATGHATNHVVVKMDVEGAEWDALLALPDEALGRIDQLVMELHGTGDEKFVRVIRRLKQFFLVANLHMNNYACDPTHHPFPAWAYEALFVSRRLATAAEGAIRAKTYSAVDARNTTTKPDCQAR